MSGCEHLSLGLWEQVARAVLGMNADGLIRLPAHEVVAWQGALEQSAFARGQMAALDVFGRDGSSR